jgi:superfamily II DNA or RNA helicase
MEQAALEVGALVRVRGQQWLVSDVSTSALPRDELAASTLPGRTLVTLASLAEDDPGEELSVIWEVEPGRAVVPCGHLPDVPEEPSRWDDPQTFAALVDAVRWGTVASADRRTLQAPFRAGIRIKDYQLEPLARALRMPRVALLVADDVGLGKTIEAGLVVEEMLLRHRARRVLVVCPASLTLKWRDEMRDKFGLPFTVLDAQSLKDLRRSHGLMANPFSVHPRTIVSLQWLRTPRVQRLLDEVLDASTRHRGFFDLLVVDEAHHCAPPAPTADRGYAVDSKQTLAVRRLSEHAQHRLFLTATPHNGYTESFEALLELVDDRRFARGVVPDQKARDEVIIRRLKDDIVDAAGNKEFPGRLPPEELEVAYTDDERAGHALLTDYVSLRRRTGSPKGGDLVTLLLKKRFFSSPAAFARTLDCHVESLRAGSRAAIAATPAHDRRRVPAEERFSTELFGVGYDWGTEPDDAAGSEAELALFLGVSATLGETNGTTNAAAALAKLLEWARSHTSAADSKAERLVDELRRICLKDGEWNDERVVVFTEYVDTQQWLARILAARGLGADGRVALLSGGMDEKRRERLKSAFQARPSRDPVRILLATDAASEGIDLQEHCCRVVNYDIPFNPNRLEQRIGRVDRFGQRRPVHVSHFVGAGWQEAQPGSYDADLEFLSRVANKVAHQREALGKVNAILARAVEARMLGRPLLDDPFAPSPKLAELRAERDLREEVARLRAQISRSVEELHVAPANVRRVVDVALDLADQPPLQDRPDGLVAAPRLTRGWERTLAGIEDPLDLDYQRPLTFDASQAGPDVVYAHLGWGLVDHAQRLLRSAVWGEHRKLACVTAAVAELPEDLREGELLVAAFSRFVVVGADGARLHEQVLLTARAVPVSGRSRRLELDERRYEHLRQAVERALGPDRCRPASMDVRARLAALWPDLQAPLLADVESRAQASAQALERDLERRLHEDLDRVDAVIEHMRRSLELALAEGPGVPEQLSFADLDHDERAQLERDREAWKARLERLEDDRLAERAALERRYRGMRTLTFPFALCLLVRADRDSAGQDRDRPW